MHPLRVNDCTRAAATLTIIENRRHNWKGFCVSGMVRVRNLQR